MQNKFLSKLILCCLSVAIGVPPVTYADLYFKRNIRQLVVSTPSDNGGGSNLSGIVEVSTSSLSFGAVPVGTTSGLSVTILNSGTAALTIQEISSSTASFTVNSSCPTSLGAGASCDVTVNFAPTSTLSQISTLSIGTSVGSKTVSLMGSGSQSSISFSPVSNTDYGSVATGDFAEKSFIVQNTGTLNVSGVYPSVSGAGFTIVNNSCGTAGSPISQAPGNTCTYSVRYSPTTVGTATGSTTIHSSANSGNGSHSLTGQGVLPAAAIASLSSALIHFTTLSGTTSAASSVVLSNTGTANLDITSMPVVGGANSDQFSVSHNCTSVLAPSASCTISAEFSPTTPGTKTANISFLTSDGQKTITLSGVASAPVSAATSGLLYQVQSISALPYAATKVNATSTQYVYVIGAGDVGSVSTTATIEGADADQFKFTAVEKYLVSYSNEFWASTASCGASVSSNSTSSCVADPMESNSSSARNNVRYSVQFAPTSPGSKSATLKVYHNGSGGSPETISLSGTATQVASASYSTSNLNFGAVSVPNTGSMTISVINDGDLPLTFNTPTVSNAGTANVSYIGCSAVLAVGDTCDYTIGFTPVDTSSINATFTISSNAGTKIINIAGSGNLRAATATMANGSNFGAVAYGTTVSRTVTYSNTGNLSLSGVYAAITGTGFSISSNTCGTQASPVTVAVNGTCTLVVAFSPTLNPVNYSGTLTINSNANSGPASLAITGTSQEVTDILLSTSALSYTTVLAGTSAGSKDVQITNSGNTTVSLSTPTISNAGTSAITYSSTCPSTLAPGDSCIYTIAFKPNDGSAINATFAINSSAGTDNVTISGTGLVKAATLTPSSGADFGTIGQGQTVTHTFTLQNTGTTSLTTIYASLTNASMFSMSANTCGTSSAKITLAVNASCSVSVTYAPGAAVGTHLDTLTLSSDAFAGNNSLALTGSSTDLTQFSAGFDTTGNFNADFAIGGVTATQVGTTTKSVASGYFTQTAAGDTTPGYLEYPASSSYPVGLGDFYFEARVNRTTRNGTNSAGILQLYDPTDTTKSLLFFIDDVSATDARFGVQAGLGFNPTGAWTTTGPNTIGTGTWYTLAVKRKNNVTQLFINGVAQILYTCTSSGCTNTNATSGAGTTNYSSASFKPMIGGRIDLSRPFRGSIDYVKFSKYAP